MLVKHSVLKQLFLLSIIVMLVNGENTNSLSLEKSLKEQTCNSYAADL